MDRTVLVTSLAPAVEDDVGIEGAVRVDRVVVILPRVARPFKLFGGEAHLVDERVDVCAELHREVVALDVVRNLTRCVYKQENVKV